MSAVWPLGILIPPFSNNFYPHFHWISLTFDQYVDFCACTCLFGHHHPPSSIWAILSLYGPVPSPIYWVFTNKSNFHQTSLIFQLFAHMCTCFGYHHPPRAAITLHNQLATYPTHLLAPVPPFDPFPIEFIDFHQFYHTSTHPSI